MTANTDSRNPETGALRRAAISIYRGSAALLKGRTQIETLHFLISPRHVQHICNTLAYFVVRFVRSLPHGVNGTLCHIPMLRMLVSSLKTIRMLVIGFHNTWPQHDRDCNENTTSVLVRDWSNCIPDRGWAFETFTNLETINAAMMISTRPGTN